MSDTQFIETTQSFAGRPRLLNRLRQALLTRALSQLTSGHLGLTLPDGTARMFGDAAHRLTAHLRLKSWRAVDRIVTGGDIGLAEGYIAGDWTTPDLGALFDVIIANEKALTSRLPGLAAFRLLGRLRHVLNSNTRQGSRANISFHYDLGNDFYAQWLDSTMTYSAARFVTPDMDLEAAQLAKYRGICRALDIRPGQKILEIGCGWGGFAEVAAKEFGAHVHGITLSKEQLAYAKARTEHQKLTGRTHFTLTDYRDVKGSFDHVVSIEMFEAVGQAYWQGYFRRLTELVKPGGRIFLQIITIDNARFQSYARRPDFIQRHVFPGGMLPSPAALETLFAQSGLACTSATYAGDDYARTLALWRQRFRTAWSTLENEGFDERFKRLWDYYLSYCEAGFRHGTIDLGRFVLERSAQPA